MSVNATSHIAPVTGVQSLAAVPEDYLALIGELPLWPIKSTGAHRRAMAIANRLLATKAKTGKLSRGEAAYLTVLIELLETYEKAKLPRRRVSDSEMLTHLVEAKNVTQVEVERSTGIAAPTISAVMAGRRRLTRDQIGRLASYFGVAPTVFSFDA